MEGHINQELQVWVAEYRLIYTDQPNKHHYGSFISYAQTREAFESRVKRYCEIEECQYHCVLAPIPALLWFNRHAMNGSLMYHAQQLTHDSIRFIRQHEQIVDVAKQNYIQQQEFPIQPFTQELGQNLPFVPEVLQSSFFSDFYCVENDASTPDYRYFAVVDCAKSTLFPVLFNHLGQTETLFGDDIIEALYDVSPQLTQLSVNEHQQSEFVRGCFTQTDNLIFGFWELNPAIFIRTSSNYSFAEVHAHLQQFTQFYNEKTQKEYFFRFYEPLVLINYLEHISSHPDRLAAFFGVKDGKPLIESFALRVGNVFHTFSLSSLPEGTQPTTFEYGEFEEELFVRMKQNKLLAEIMANNLEETNLSKFAAEHTDNVSQWIRDGVDSGFTSTSELRDFVYASFYLHKTSLTIKLLTHEIYKKYGDVSKIEFAKLLHKTAKKLGT